MNLTESLLEGKVNDIEMEKFKIGTHRGNSKPFAAMSSKGLIGSKSHGPSAEMCGPGDECPDWGKKDKKKKFKKKKFKNKRNVKRKGTLEKESYVQEETTPAETVSVSQTTSGGKTTNWRDSENYNSVKEFKDDVNKTNIIKSDIGSKASEYIKPETEKQFLREDNLTRRNQKGKAKYSVKRTGYGEKNERATRRNPDALVTRKDRVIGKDKVRSYTTNEAHSSKQNKLVSEKKMKKLAARATKNLTKGNPKKVDAPKPEKYKSKSVDKYM